MGDSSGIAAAVQVVGRFVSKQLALESGQVHTPLDNLSKEE
jgi:hypothetical protein